MKKTEAGVQACIDFLRRRSKEWRSVGSVGDKYAVVAMVLEDYREEILDEAAKLRLRKPKW